MSSVKVFMRRLSTRSSLTAKKSKKSQSVDGLQNENDPRSNDSPRSLVTSLDDVWAEPKEEVQHRPQAAPSSTQSDKNQSTQWIFETIQLSRRNRGLGFTVAGGTENDDASNGGDANFYVTKVIDGGAAAEDGRLRVGDIIVSVNGTSYQGLTHREAVDLLKRSPQEVVLVVKRLPAGAMESIVEIRLVKGDRGLGFTVAGGVDDLVLANDCGVFVTRIIPGGVAAFDGRLAVGDRIISVNDIDLRSVKHETAVSTLKSVARVARLVVGKAPMPPGGNTNNINGNNKNGTSNGLINVSARLAFDSQSESLLKTPLDVRDDVVDSDDYDDDCTPSSTSSMTSHRGGDHQRRSSPLPQLVTRTFTDTDVPSFVKEPREITLRKKPNQGLGINVVGGKEGHGVFIASIVPGGVADLHGGLRRGDQLLAANGITLVEASHEEAVTALKIPGKTTSLVVQYRPEEFGHFDRMVRELHQKASRGAVTKPLTQKTMFIRALFDYDPTRDTLPPFSHGLKFSFGEILHVFLSAASDADWWQARRVLPWSMDEDSSSGLIPSKSRIEAHAMEKLNSFAPFNYDNGMENDERENGRRYGRSHSNDRTLSLSKKGTLPATTNVRYDLVTSLIYEPAIQIQVKYHRPLVIIGPLKTTIYDQLMTEFPNDFRSCVPHTSRPKRIGEFNDTDYHFVESKEEMRRDFQRLKSPYIEAGSHNGHLYGIAIDSVRQVGKEGKHCVLDVTPEAIVRLHSFRVYPISILIRPSHPTTMSNASWDKPFTDEEAKRVYSTTTKVLHDFGKYFTAVINAETPVQVYARVKEIIEEQSESVAWIAASNSQL